MVNRLYILLLACTIGFSQINWEIEILDTVVNPPNEFQYQNSLALDRNEIPHIVFNKANFTQLVYATRIDSNLWVKENVDSGLFYAGLSLVFDKNNIPHCSFYQKISTTAYLCHAYRDSVGWIKEIVDSTLGIITNYWFSWEYLQTMVAVDTCNLPGIAFFAWDQRDSVFYVKYDHFNGINWDTSIVEYDSAWSPHLQPSDWSVNLNFSHQNIPIIAFHQIYSGLSNDTIKLAHWDDSLNSWMVESVINRPYGGASISLALDNQNYPYIAHGVDIGLYCSWWDGIIWQSEYTGIDIGWLNMKLALDLDNSGNPHIFYHATGPVKYCYKDIVWYDCGRLDSTLDNLGDISLTLNSIAQPNVSFRFGDWDSINQYNFFGMKYGIGTIIAVKEETNDKLDALAPMKIYPNPFTTKTTIVLSQNSGFASEPLRIYDIIGREVKIFRSQVYNDGSSHVIYWDGTDDLGNRLPQGVYFIALTKGKSPIHQKIILSGE